MKKHRTVSLFSCLVLVPLAVLSMAANKCGSNEDDDQTVPTTKPTPTPTPTPTVEIPPQDAGTDAEDATDAADADADADAKVVGGDPTGVRACCAALRQNAKSAPLQQQGAYLLAAGACDAMVNNPQGRAGLSSLRGMLGGAGLPAACK